MEFNKKSNDPQPMIQPRAALELARYKKEGLERMLQAGNKERGEE